MSGLLRHLPVAQKLFLSFGALCLLMIGVGVTGLVELQRADARLDSVYRTNLHATAVLGQVRADVQEARALTSTLILHSPAADVGNIEQAVKRLDAEIDDTWADYTSGTKADRDSFTAALAGYRKVRNESLIPAARADDLDRYLAFQSGQA